MEQLPTQESFLPSKKEIIEALREHDVSRLLSVLVRLDSYLTGIDTQRSIIETQTSEITSFLDRSSKGEEVTLVVYLSDSGMSRLVFLFEEGEFMVELSNNSLQGVRKKWDTLK